MPRRFIDAPGKPRPVLRYHGGKWVLAPWIISHLPPHRVYTEVFGGAASVLLRKQRSYAEVYNDLDGEVVNLFRILRGERAAALVDAIRLTPFARDEFLESYEPTDDPIEQARRTVVRSFMGFGSAAASGKKTGFRSNSNRRGTTPAHDWGNLPSALIQVVERLQGVVIEMDATKVRHKRDPGRCFIKAGFRHVGYTKVNKLLCFQMLPAEMPAPDACGEFQYAMGM